MFTYARYLLLLQPQRFLLHRHPNVEATLLRQALAKHMKHGLVVVSVRVCRPLVPCAASLPVPLQAPIQLRRTYLLEPQRFLLRHPNVEATLLRQALAKHMMSGHFVVSLRVCPPLVPCAASPLPVPLRTSPYAASLLVQQALFPLWVRRRHTRLLRFHRRRALMAASTLGRS